jgi:centromere protein J
LSADGRTTKVYYYNGDVKETLASGLVKYFYSQTKTWHLTYPDGKEVLQFST